MNNNTNTTNSNLPSLTEGWRGMLANLELEQGILSTLIWDTTISFPVATDGLTPDCFSCPQYRRLFMALSQMTEKGISIHEPTLVVDAYNRVPAIEGDGGSISLAQYIDIVSSSPYRLDIAENVPQYIRVLIDLANRRRMLGVLRSSCEQLEDLSIDADDTSAMAIKALTESTAASADAFVSFSEAQQLMMDSINGNANGTSLVSFPTAFRSLDICGGLHPGNLVVIAALSSHGKSALAMTLAMNMLMNSEKAKVCFYSLEMTSRELMARIMARFCGIASNRLMYSKLDNEETTKVDRAVRDTSEYDRRMFFYEMKGTSVESISQNIRHLHAKEGITVAVIDYLQILGLKAAKGQTRETMVATAARDFKNLADKLGIVIILLSQMNRDNSLGRVPSVNRIRDSGEINESADVTLVIYRPEQENDSALKYPGRWENVDIHNTALITVAKDRNGGTGGTHEFMAGFNPQLTYFYELQQLPQRQQSDATSQTMHPW